VEVAEALFRSTRTGAAVVVEAAKGIGGTGELEGPETLGSVGATGGVLSTGNTVDGADG